MQSLATRSVMDEFTPEEIRRMHEANLAECPLEALRLPRRCRGGF